jgi:hypothetical protein
MGPAVPREAQRLVCVCTNEFAQTLPSREFALSNRAGVKLLTRE